MKQQVLKVLANPARIFYVPYMLAVINFVVLFLIYVAVSVVFLVTKGDFINPLWFLIAVIITHSIWAFFSKKDPQLGQIIVTKLKLLKYKIPKRLVT